MLSANSTKHDAPDTIPLDDAAYDAQIRKPWRVLEKPSREHEITPAERVYGVALAVFLGIVGAALLVHFLIK